MGILHILKKTVLTSTLLSCAMSVQAGLFDDDEARQAILDIREKINKFQATTVDRFDQNSRSLLDLQNQITQLKEEVATLRGDNESLKHRIEQIEQLQTTLKNYYQDIDTRLQKFEPKQVTVDGQAGTVSPAEVNDYEAALKFFRGNDVPNALHAFQAFITRYPDSVYLPLAQFWLGSIFYVQRNYKEALTTLHAMIRKTPEHPKVADAWVVIGNCQAESGQKQQARKTFMKVVSQYPNSGAATLAKQRLAELK